MLFFPFTRHILRRKTTWEYRLIMQRRTEKYDKGHTPEKDRQNEHCCTLAWSFARTRYLSVSIRSSIHPIRTTCRRGEHKACGLHSRRSSGSYSHTHHTPTEGNQDTTTKEDQRIEKNWKSLEGRRAEMRETTGRWLEK